MDWETIKNLLITVGSVVGVGGGISLFSLILNTVRGAKSSKKLAEIVQEKGLKEAISSIDDQTAQLEKITKKLDEEHEDATDVKAIYVEVHELVTRMKATAEDVEKLKEAVKNVTNYCNELKSKSEESEVSEEK